MKHDKKLLVDVFNAYYYKKDATGKRNLVFMSKNLTVGGIVNSQETTDVRNGQGNKVFAILPGQKDVTINLTENVFSFEALEANTGSIAATNQTATIISEVVTYKAGTLVGNPNYNAGENTIKVKETPLHPDELIVFWGEKQLAFDGTTTNKEKPAADGQFKFDTNNNMIVLHDTDNGNAATTQLKIMPFLHNTEHPTAEVLTIKASEFATGGELWLETLEKDTNQKATAKVYFVFENAFPDGNFELNTQSEVQPVDMTVNMRAIANDEDELYKIIRVPV